MIPVEGTSQLRGFHWLRVLNRWMDGQTFSFINVDSIHFYTYLYVLYFLSVITVVCNFLLLKKTCILCFIH